MGDGEGMSRRRVVAALLVAAIAPALPAQALPDKFDPARDAAKDLAAALALARAQGKRVIIDVGGEWCSWCHILDRFFAAHPDLDALRASRYVWLKVNWSRENRNEALLSRWPAVAGYPHLFVLAADGTLVHSQDTGALELGRSYGAAKVRDFLVRQSGERR
jgi:thiol:disulfide interchange protein